MPTKVHIFKATVFPVVMCKCVSWTITLNFVVVVQSLNHVQLFATPCIAARQASLSFTILQSLLKLMSIKSVMLYNHLNLYHPLLCLPSNFPSIRVFSNYSALRIRWPKYWSFSIHTSNEHLRLNSFRIE